MLEDLHIKWEKAQLQPVVQRYMYMFLMDFYVDLIYDRILKKTHVIALLCQELYRISVEREYQSFLH